jgi:hypothetical protein
MTSDSKDYVRAVLEMYARTPNTIPPRTSDRRLAADLYDQSVPLATIEAALLLATARRLSRSPIFPFFQPSGPWLTSFPSSKKSADSLFPHTTSTISATKSTAFLPVDVISRLHDRPALVQKSSLLSDWQQHDSQRRTVLSQRNRIGWQKARCWQAYSISSRT